MHGNLSHDMDQGGPGMQGTRVSPRIHPDGKLVQGDIVRTARQTNLIYSSCNILVLNSCQGNAQMLELFVRCMYQQVRKDWCKGSEPCTKSKQ